MLPELDYCIKTSSYILYNKDCLDILKSLSDNSVDSLVTDPPAGISFMGKDWDGNKGGSKEWIAWLSSVMKECLRVMKPGAHGLVWAIPRTSHWTATALEDAGFEIRDVITHIFGSGFPKSLNISKAIDKAAGAEREVTGHQNYSAPDIRGNAYDQSHVSDRERLGVPITKASTPEAKQWEGFGTALKPANEHWILIRKPLSEKTVAANVLKHGTGGLNIDGSRIGTDAGWSYPNGPGGNKINGGNLIASNGEKRTEPLRSTQGRFPANLVLSHNPDCEDKCTEGCAAAALDEQSGILISKWGKQKTKHEGDSSMFGLSVPDSVNKFSGDQGGASRFFYCAKASKRDKGADNTHPTVKSSTLMSYLIKLVTPPNGLILDPFMGSGSTGVSALREGFRFIGIEKELEYFNISENRIFSDIDLRFKQGYAQCMNRNAGLE